MKNILLILIPLLFIFCSCEKDFLDVNQNPNTPDKMKSYYLLPSAEISIAYYLGFAINKDGMLLTQQWSTTYTQYEAVDRYRLDHSSYGNEWSNFYSVALADLKVTQDLAKEESNPNIESIAIILECYLYHALTDMFGDIPYSQAINIEKYPSPKYDKVSDIYPALLKRIDAAIALMSGDKESKLATQDVIYKGDMGLWKKFANSLKIRMLMRMSNTDAFSTTTLKSLFDGNDIIMANSDNAIFTYGTKSGNFNPLFERLTSSGRDKDLGSGKTLIDIMNVRNDPRLPYYFSTAPGTTKYIGNPNGESKVVVENMSTICNWWFDKGNTKGMKRPTLLLSAAEMAFFKAEAAAKGYITGDVADLYAKAIKLSMGQWIDDKEKTITDEAIASYIVANPYNDVNDIYLQRYIALYDQGLQVYSEWRRTDVPKLTPVTTSENGDKIPIKFPYPASEYDTNGDNVPKTDINTAIWWDQ